MPPPFLNHFHAYKNCPVLFFLSHWLLSLHLRTWGSSSAQSLVWLPAEPSEMVCRKTLLQAQNQHLSSSHESSAGIMFSAREYYNQRFEKIDKNHWSTTLYADTTNFHIDRIEGLWRRSISFTVPFLMIVLTSSFFRYCEVVDIDPYYTLKKSTEGRIKNFFHWLSNNYSVKKISSVETYWHQLSQLYIKWKGRRISPLILKQIFDVNDKKHRCFDMADKEIVH